MDIRCEPIDYSLPPCDSPHEEHLAAFDHVTSIRDCFEQDWRAFTVDHGPDYIAVTNTIHIGVHPFARVPDSLVTGPFNWEKARLLFWLRCNGAALTAPAPDANWELVKLGFENIFGLDDETLVYLLVRLFHSWDVLHSNWPEHISLEVDKGLRSRFHKPLLVWFFDNLVFV